MYVLRELMERVSLLIPSTTISVHACVCWKIEHINLSSPCAPYSPLSCITTTITITIKQGCFSMYLTVVFCEWGYETEWSVTKW